MNATEAQIEERFPVWDALSEFFLDTALQPADYEHIAKVLAASSYTEDEIEHILTDEVCPACRVNMLSPAGEWIGFDPDWLKKEAGKRFGKRPKFRSLIMLRDHWMFASHWNEVRKLIAAYRTG